MQKLKLTKKKEKYPEYKDSGVEWLGEVPEGWNTDTLRHIGYFSASGIDKKFLENEVLIEMVNYTDIYGNNRFIIDRNIKFRKTTTTPEKILKHSLKKGDVLFTPSSETEEDVGVSAVVYEDLPDVVYSYHLIRFRPHKNLLNYKFTKYFFNNNFVLSQFSSLCTGTTRMVLGRSDFKNTKVVVPSIKIQQKIADYLDQKTETIDKIIEKKKRLVALLEEKRASVINHAVTKGLDPNAELVDSGIDWIGKIPKGWNIDTLRRLGHFSASGIDKKFLEDEVEVEMVNYTDVYGNNRFIIDRSIKFRKTTTTPEKISKHSLKKGDVIFTPSSETEEDVGVSAVVYEDLPDVVYSYHVIRFRPHDGLLNFKFAKYFLNNNFVLSQFSSLCTGTTRMVLGRSDFKNTKVVVPPVETQQKIADYLDQKTETIDKIIEKTKQSIKLLQEYRASLISNVVTGKIKI